MPTKLVTYNSHNYAGTLGSGLYKVATVTYDCSCNHHRDIHDPDPQALQYSY